MASCAIAIVRRSPDDSSARNTASRYLAAAHYLDNLPPASRAVVLGDIKARELLDSLDTPDKTEQLLLKLASLGHHAAAGSSDDFRRLMNVEPVAICTK